MFSNNVTSNFLMKITDDLCRYNMSHVKIEAQENNGL